MIPEVLKKILVCPKCRGEVEFRESEARILCQACQLAYPIQGDLPIMLVRVAQPLHKR